jgi:hypothetical protein
MESTCLAPAIVCVKSDEGESGRLQNLPLGAHNLLSLEYSRKRVSKHVRIVMYMYMSHDRISITCMEF